MTKNLITNVNIQKPINNYENMKFQANANKTPINSEEIFSI